MSEDDPVEAREPDNLRPAIVELIAVHDAWQQRVSAGADLVVALREAHDRARPFVAPIRALEEHILGRLVSISPATLRTLRTVDLAPDSVQWGRASRTNVMCCLSGQPATHTMHLLQSPVVSAAKGAASPVWSQVHVAYANIPLACALILVLAHGHAWSPLYKGAKADEVHEALTSLVAYVCGRT